jgi:hypothetical protein
VCQHCGDILQAGAAAGDELLADVLRVPIEKALNPLKQRQFVTLIRRVARSLRDAASPIEQQAVEKATAILDANWPDLTKAARAEKLREVEDLLAQTGEKLLPGVKVVFNVASDQIIPPTRRAVASTFKLDIQSDLTKRDKRTSEFLVETEGLFVRDDYGEVSTALTEKARGIVATGLESGLGREDISADLIAAMAGARRPDSYWGNIATVFSNRARNFTQIHAFQDAAIKAFMIEAVLDAATSEQCRFLHHKQFPVDGAAKRIEKVQAAPDPTDIVDLMPWIQKGKNEDGQAILYYKRGETRHLVANIDESGEGEDDKIGQYSKAMPEEAMAKAGIGMPPFHGHCRTTVVPVF